MVEDLKGAPLNAMRAFEAAARTGSFAAAARELDVTPAAISQQVKLLENHWGRTLFARQGNRITLTDAGSTAFPPIVESLRTLEELSLAMKGEPRRAQLVISVPHSVAETWLSLKLRQWQVTNPDSKIDIRVENDPVDFAEDRIHLRVFYGKSLYPDFKNETLFVDEMVAVASPEFAAKNGFNATEIPKDLLIHADWGRDFASVPEWSNVFQTTQHSAFETGIRVATSSVAISCACGGIGAALVPLAMAQQFIASGELLRLNAVPLPMPRPYSAAIPHTIAHWNGIQEFIAILKN